MTFPGARRQRRSLAIGLVLAALLAAVGAAPASAAVVLRESGLRGPYVVADQIEEPRLPGARCGYGAENASGDAFFRWMKFRKPDVYARDTGEGAQQQRVRLTYRLQRNTATGWKTVASLSQTETAHETMPAEFVPRKLYYDGSAGDLLRGVVVIKWLRNGSVEGSVALRLEYYSVKWTVGTPDYIFEDACDGAAD